MPKKCDDRRKNNRPPEEHQIRKGEVRNPDGRRGKARATAPSTLDAYILEQSKRIVSRGPDGEVTAIERLVQEEFHSALVGKDANARARMLKAYRDADERHTAGLREFLDWFIATKHYYEREYRLAEALRMLPPDTVHPSHVHFDDGRLHFTGPVDQESRRMWEDVKASIKICAWMHQRARLAYRLAPTKRHRNALKVIEKHRRSLMRQVPKGWNWREEIYCRHSRTAFVQETIAKLENLL